MSSLCLLASAEFLKVSVYADLTRGEWRRLGAVGECALISATRSAGSVKARRMASVKRSPGVPRKPSGVVSPSGYGSQSVSLVCSIIGLYPQRAQFFLNRLLA